MKTYPCGHTSGMNTRYCYVCYHEHKYQRVLDQLTCAATVFPTFQALLDAPYRPTLGKKLGEAYDAAQRRAGSEKRHYPK